MKLWLLEARKGLPDGDNPWERWYSTITSFVIRAETEMDARRLATENGRDEVEEFTIVGYIATAAWSDAKYSTCVELVADGDEGVILSDYNAA